MTRVIGSRCALLVAVGAFACAWMAPGDALGAVGDLTFSGCIGMDSKAGCTQTSPPSLLAGADSVAISADGTSAYLAANTGSATGLIDEFSRNASTGALTFQACLGDGAGAPCTATNPANSLGEPESVAASADGNDVYVAARAAGAVDVFSRNASTGLLTFAGCVGNAAGCPHISSTDALTGADTVALSADGTSVYVGSKDSLDVFSRDTSTGALTYQSCIGGGEGCTPTTPAAAVTELRSVAVSADGTSVYAANFSLGVIDVFSRNTTTGALTYDTCIGSAATGCPTTIENDALAGAQSLAVSPDGTSVYAAAAGNPGPGAVVAFSRDTSTGALAYQACFGPLPLPCTATAPSGALEQASGVAVSPDGASVYAASQHSNSVDVFARNVTGGELTYESCIGDQEGCTATNPSDALDDANSVAASADGTSVYAAAGGPTNGGTINQFSRATTPPVTPSVTCENITQTIAYPAPTATITLKCSDNTGEPLSYAIVSGPEPGKLGPIGASGTVTYTPPFLYIGKAAFSYAASDSQAKSNVATVNLTISLPSAHGGPVLAKNRGPRRSTPPALARASTPQITRAVFDNQRITLTTPSLQSCTAKGKALAVKLSSKAIPGSRAPKLRFARAAFYIDKGIRHTHKKTIRTRSGKKKTITVVTYTPNATARHVPATLGVSLTGVKSGTHKLTVKLFYKRTRRRHGHRTTVIVTKTVSTQIKVC